MSDREMRELLRSVIHDIDSGRLRVLRHRPGLWQTVGAAAMASAIALSAGACVMYGQPDYGVPPVDAAVDAAPDGSVDAGPLTEYMAPPAPPIDTPSE